MLWRARKKNRQQGQAMVETALMMLVILLLLMGIIQFGFIFYAYVRVSNSAREGARAGSLWLVDREVDDGYYAPILCDRVLSAAQSEVSAIEPGDITIAVVGQDPVNCVAESVDPQAGEPITVTLNYDYELPVVAAVPIIRDIISSPYPVSRTVVMRFQ